MKSQDKDQSKSRQDWVYGSVNVGEEGVLTVHYDWQNDEIEIEAAEKGSMRTERSYARESGKPKVVSSVPSDGKSAFTAKKALFAYDWIVAVDTNTRIISGERCAVCVSYFTPKPPASCCEAGVRFLCLAAYLIVGVRHGIIRNKSVGTLYLRGISQNQSLPGSELRSLLIANSDRIKASTIEKRAIT